MEDRKKILVLTSRFPYPVIGGDRLRIYNQCKELSKYYDLTLLSLCDSKDELIMPVPEDGVFKSVKRIYLPKWRSYLNSLFALFASKPLQVAYYESRAYQYSVNELLAEHDLALCHLIRTTHYVHNFTGRKVVEMTDAISLNYQRVKENKDLKGLKALVYRIEQKRLLKYECSILNQFDACSLISKIDKQYLLDRCGDEAKNIVISGNGVEIAKYPFQFHPYQVSETLRIVFIGAMSTLQNYDAAYWFANTVLPLIAKQHPVVFEVVGRIPQRYQEELSSIKNVVVLGSVKSVPVAVKGAHIGVCPMRIGAGVQNKVLEYMALGLPCITTSMGLEGIMAVPAKDLLVADKPIEFVQALNDLLSDKNFAVQMASSARTLIEDEYTWQSQQESFLGCINGLVGK